MWQQCKHLCYRELLKRILFFGLVSRLGYFWWNKFLFYLKESWLTKLNISLRSVLLALYLLLSLWGKQNEELKCPFIFFDRAKFNSLLQLSIFHTFICPPPSLLFLSLFSLFSLPRVTFVARGFHYIPNSMWLKLS